MADQRRLDPTQTGFIRRAALRDMRKRIARLQKDIRELVDTEDAFGLREDDWLSDWLRSAGMEVVVTNTRWRFATNSEKIKSFRDWLRERLAAGLLETVDGDDDKPWFSTYIQSAYRKAMVTAYTQSKKQSGDISQSRKEFLDETFAAPETTRKLQMLYTRSFELLSGITSDISSKLSTILVDGLSRGDNPRTMARAMTKEVESIGKRRALTLARTEIIHAHAEGQLDGYQRLGVDEVGALAEWSTAGDHRVCPRCQPLEGVVMKVDKARGLLPRHPNCRCMWVPALEGMPMAGQKRTKAQVQAAVKKSIQAERPKKKYSEAKAQTSWTGADVTFTTVK